MESSFRYSSFVDDPDSTHNLVVSLVPSGARVLEFGCATGYMSEVLKARLGCTVIGIEVDEEAAKLARAHCERVIVGDAETLDYADLFGDEQFDVIIFADVLEHLQHPDTVLRKVASLLAPTGKVVVSIPNVAHGAVRLALLHGEFRYRPSGILDETHIRFFTRTSLQELFESSGYLVTRWLRKHTDIGGTEIGVSAAQVPQRLWRQLSEDPESTTYQFVVQAVPAESAVVVHELRSKLADTDDALQESQRIVAERDQQLEEAHARVRNLQDEYDRDVARRDEHIAHLEQEVQKIEQAEVRIAWLEQDILQRDQHIMQLDQDAQQVGQMYREIEQRDKHIAQLDAHVAAHNERLAQRDQRIVQLEQEVRTIAKQQQDAPVLQQRLASLQAEVQHHEAMFTRLQQERQQRDATIASLQKQLKDIQSSRTWHVAQSYWRLRKSVARAKASR